MTTLNPFLATDGYKTGHHRMYPQGTTMVYSNFTPRSNYYAPRGIDYVVSFGQQMIMKQINEMFESFFLNEARNAIKFRIEKYDEVMADTTNLYNQLNALRNSVVQPIKDEYSMYLGTDYDVSHIEALWDLGYLPIEVKALPEGTSVPMGVPVLTIKNTLPEFYWLTNFLETLISNLLWKPITSATIAKEYKTILLKYAMMTDEKNVGFVNFQGHDFSMRGMDSIDAVISSGLGHATSFDGSDSLPTIHGARKYYGATGFVIGSVNATEHSVMCAGGDDDEIGTFRYLMKQFPSGILSVVSDTWNLWDVLTKILPTLKDEIMARDGKLVIRPDSGNPVDIICGYSTCSDFEMHEKRVITSPDKPEYKGVIQLLWDLFGGTVNEQGYKVLDPHIGAIYGDSITLDRADEICRKLMEMGFASTNIVLGIGSFTYQYNTRDTFGFAMKATYVEINGVGREIFKNPVTDSGSKKSAKGLLQVVKEDGKYKLRDQVNLVEENEGELQTIFIDGKFFNVTTLKEIRERQIYNVDLAK